jgi:hypothetical protein
MRIRECELVEMTERRKVDVFLCNSPKIFMSVAKQSGRNGKGVCFRDTRESVNRTQMDIKRKRCDIRTWENIYFSSYLP